MDTLKDTTILAIDDDKQILTLLKIILGKKCQELALQNDPVLGLEFARTHQPDLILLDVMINRISGYDICKQLKADAQTKHIPVIFLSSLAAPEDKVKGFAVGGVDFISKPFDINEVLVRIISCLATHKKIQQKPQPDLEKPAEMLLQYQFNKRELEVLRMYISGYKRSDIAAKIYVSENTVKWYLKQIFQKLGVESRAALLEKMHGLAF